MLANGSGNDRLQHQLNVTPFIDVMLVLLVIFMMASSAMIADMQINLPAAQSSQDRMSTHNETVAVNIFKSGEIYIQSQLVQDNDLISTVNSFKKDGEVLIAIINADEDVHYGRVVTVMDALKKNGVTRVSLATKHT